MGRYRVGIVIPAFNEEKTIGDVVKKVCGYGIVIVIDDGSRDGTYEAARKAGAIVISNPKNIGYDGALNLGFRKSAELGVSLVITMDADGQHDPLLIEQMICEINSGVDVVIGVRRIKQRYSALIFGCVTKFIFDIDDPLCGMKAYKIDVYEELGHFDSYTSIGTELVLYAAIRNYKIAQISCPTAFRQDKPRFGNSLSANLRIIRALNIAILKLAKWKLKNILSST